MTKENKEFEILYDKFGNKWLLCTMIEEITLHGQVDGGKRLHEIRIPVGENFPFYQYSKHDNTITLIYQGLHYKIYGDGRKLDQELFNI